MKVDILCTDPKHPVVPYLAAWMQEQSADHNVVLHHQKEDLRGGDILFLVSCSDIIHANIRQKFKHSFVLHASDLPKGRGWSPYIWDILKGAETITVSLLSASDAVDRGDIWAKKRVPIPKHFLVDEINDALFKAEIALLGTALDLVADGTAQATRQDETAATYHPKRSPKDSEIDPSKPLADVFDQIRIADPDRYPAFFRLHGATYQIFLKKGTIDD